MHPKGAGFTRDEEGGTLSKITGPRKYPPAFEFWIWGLGFGVWGLGFEVWDLGFGVWDLGFGVWVSGFRVWSLALGFASRV